MAGKAQQVEERGTPGFVHLHLHTEYSLLDGGNRMDKLVARVEELGMTAVGSPTTGTSSGPSRLPGRKDAGIKPILGVEAYVTPPGKPRTDRTYAGGGEGGYHLVLLAETTGRGGTTCCTCAREAYLTGFYYKPRIDRELLAKHSEGLIAINGHLGSEIGDHLLEYERSGDGSTGRAVEVRPAWHAAGASHAQREEDPGREDVPVPCASSSSSSTTSPSRTRSTST